MKKRSMEPSTSFSTKSSSEIEINAPPAKRLRLEEEEEVTRPTVIVYAKKRPFEHDDDVIVISDSDDDHNGLSVHHSAKRSRREELRAEKRRHEDDDGVGDSGASPAIRPRLEIAQPAVVAGKSNSNTLPLHPKRRWLMKHSSEADAHRQEQEQTSTQSIQEKHQQQQRQPPHIFTSAIVANSNKAEDPARRDRLKRTCDICHLDISRNNWSRHVKSKGHITKCNVKSSSATNAAVVTKFPKPAAAATSAVVAKQKTQVVDDQNKQKKKNIDVELIRSAFKNRLKTYSLSPSIGTTYCDPNEFLKDCEKEVDKLIAREVDKNPVKVNLVFLADFVKDDGASNMSSQKMNFKTTNEVILLGTDISAYYRQAFNKIMNEFGDFEVKGSQWRLGRIDQLQVRINRYTPLGASSYLELPREIAGRHAVINIQNRDQECFKWAIIAALHPANDHVNRVSQYQLYANELDAYLRDITFPVTLTDIDKFERRSGLTINVYTYNDKFMVYPLRISNRYKPTADHEEEDGGRYIDLLYMKNNKGETHYCYIKSMSRLVSMQISKHNMAKHICRRCLRHSPSADALVRHHADCVNHDAVKIVMPSSDFKIRFKNGNRSMRVPYVFYADFECLLRSVAGCRPNGGTDDSYTLRYQKHEPTCFCLYRVPANGLDERAELLEYFGEDAAVQFANVLIRESQAIKERYVDNKLPMLPLTAEEQLAFEQATECHICCKPLPANNNTNGETRVRDHDHLTGKYRGPAHNRCNLNYQLPSFIPVFIHNLSGYDAHLFVKAFAPNKNVMYNVIPQNDERYISFTIKVKNGIDIRFLDSYRFMGKGLADLVKCLPRDKFVHTAGHFCEDNYDNDRRLDLVVRKGVYPYDYMDSMEKYDETSLPPRSEFYNRLTKTDVSDEDYRHAENVWQTFNIKNLREYTQLYNRTDVLILADVFENFRDLCLSTYNLDPAWFYTAPGLAWEAMLKYTDVQLDALYDHEMMLMFEKMVRGGVSQCSNRHALANNPYMGEDVYDPTKPHSYLLYLDANNMYGWAMSQPMPRGNLEWVKDGNGIGGDIDVGSFDVNAISDDSDKGYVLEVDLEYPDEIHDAHSDLPVAPERACPPSPPSQSSDVEFGVGGGSGKQPPKLLSTLYNKERYVLHYRNLKQYLELGLRITKIHRILRFDQSLWLKKYIDLNTDLRKRAKNGFEKEFYKLMNNSVFGKTMENVRKRVNVQLVTTGKKACKLIAKPNFVGRKIFSEDLAAVHMARTCVRFDKPLFVGACILDVSKTLMYDFHYNVIRRRYGEKARLQYTDTDSLTYHIETPDVYADIKTMLDHFDTSDYPENNVFGMPRVNGKVLGKFKDELNGRIMHEHVGLRSKMYASRHEMASMKTVVAVGGTSFSSVTPPPPPPPKPEAVSISENGVIKKAKGVKKSVIADELTFEDYKTCLQDQTKIYRSMNVIRSYQHELYSVELNKIALSAYDDKRYVAEDGITTLPWGHYSLRRTQVHDDDDPDQQSCSTN